MSGFSLEAQAGRDQQHRLETPAWPHFTVSPFPVWRAAGSSTPSQRLHCPGHRRRRLGTRLRQGTGSDCPHGNHAGREEPRNHGTPPGSLHRHRLGDTIGVLTMHERCHCKPGLSADSPEASGAGVRSHAGDGCTGRRTNWAGPRQWQSGGLRRTFEVLGCGFQAGIDPKHAGASSRNFRRSALGAMAASDYGPRAQHGR